MFFFVKKNQKAFMLSIRAPASPDPTATGRELGF